MPKLVVKILNRIVDSFETADFVSLFILLVEQSTHITRQRLVRIREPRPRGVACLLTMVSVQCSKQIKGLVALVTGGASGLGHATAKHLLNKGAKVVICDLPKSDGERISKDLGENCVFVATDVTSENNVNSALTLTEEHFGKLDVVVNCAGIARTSPLSEFLHDKSQLLDIFSEVLKVNLIGSFNVLRLAVGLIKKNPPDKDGQRGLIINTSSISAFDGQIGQAAYSASSGGLVSMTLPIARDLSEHGIRCCTVAPGLFHSSMTSSLPEHIVSFLSSTICFPNRFGNPEEYAHMVQHIIENPVINGEVIRLDGGLRLVS